MGYLFCEVGLILQAVQALLQAIRDALVFVFYLDAGLFHVFHINPVGITNVVAVVL